MVLFLTGLACLLFIAYVALIIGYQRVWKAIPYFIPQHPPGPAPRRAAELSSAPDRDPATEPETDLSPGPTSRPASDPATGPAARRPRITVLIPARNEEAIILDCLRSLAGQSYPKDRFEVIVLDDHSTDRTAAVVQKYATSGASGLTLRCLRIAEMVLPSGLTAYKKFAIETGVAAASGELIVTSDADCFFEPG